MQAHWSAHILPTSGLTWSIRSSLRCHFLPTSSLWGLVNHNEDGYGFFGWRDPAIFRKKAYILPLFCKYMALMSWLALLRSHLFICLFVYTSSFRRFPQEVKVDSYYSCINSQTSGDSFSIVLVSANKILWAMISQLFLLVSHLFFQTAVYWLVVFTVNHLFSQTAVYFYNESVQLNVIPVGAFAVLHWARISSGMVPSGAKYQWDNVV